MSTSVNRSCVQQPPRQNPTQPPVALNTPQPVQPTAQTPDPNAVRAAQTAIGCGPNTPTTPEVPSTPQPLNYGELTGNTNPQLGIGQCDECPAAELEALQKSQAAILDAGVALMSVLAGEDINAVAQRFDSTVEELKKLNPQLAAELDGSVGALLREGQTLAVPTGASDSTGGVDPSRIVESGPNAYGVAAPSLDAIRNGNGNVTMHRGMSGPEVRDLQRRLNQMGANPPLSTDGKFGPLTEAALQQFPSANGIQQTGMLGRQTLGSLDSNSARRIPAQAGGETAGAGSGTGGTTGPAGTTSAGNLTGTAFGNQIASAAEREARRLNSVGRCALGVNNALVSLGVPGRGHAYQKAEQLANNPRFREVNVSAGDLRNLPPGAVVVWGRSAAKPYGHVSVALGGGREASDHIQNQITGGRYGTDFGRGPDPQGRQFRVFLPR